MPSNPLIIFSPLPPMRNGIADYCGELLPWHARDFDCTVVIDNAAPDPLVPKGVRVLRLAEYEAREAEFSAVPHLYHVGNNPDHVYLMPVLMRRPGVVVVHDVSIHHLLDCQTLRWGDVRGYCDALIREYGRPGQLLASQFDTMRWREKMMFYELPANRSLVARSQAVIVHSEFARVRVQAQDASATVVHIPHHLSPAALAADSLTKRRARQQLGLDPDTLLFMSMGFVTRAKQIDSALRAMARLRDVLPPFEYLIAGEAQPDQYDVEADIARYGLEGIAKVTGYVPDELFFTYVAAADIIINLRYPTGGETSGTLIRALGTGACVVVIDTGPFAELPGDAAVKIPWGDAFEPTLQESLKSLALNPELRAGIGGAARRFLRDTHAIERSAAAYSRVITAAARDEAPWAVSAWEFVPPAVHERTLAEKVASGGMPAGPGALWWREAAAPMRGDEPVRAALCAKDPAAGPWLESLFGHAEADQERFPSGDWVARLSAVHRRSLGFLVASLPAEEVTAELWDRLTAANRALAFGGLLVLDLWQDDASPSDAIDPDLVSDLLNRAGFQLRHLWIGPSEVSFALDLRDEDAWRANPVSEVCWQVVKISEFLDPPGIWTRADAGSRPEPQSIFSIDAVPVGA